MKAEHIAERFGDLIDGPGGVKCLRNLVHKLAIEGRLVPHIASEVAIPYPSSDEGSPINISRVPDNWRVLRLSEVVKNRSGNSKLIKGKLHEEPAPGRFQGFSASGADIWCDDYEHEGPAIIVSAVGARCGKAFKASGKWSAIANTNITWPDPVFWEFDFAYLLFNNEHFWVRGGSAQPFIKFPPSLERHFALPPLAEQKRIVAKVDELMALCDRLEAQLKERDVKQAALAKAALAKFTEDPTLENLQLLFHPSFSIDPDDLRKAVLNLATSGTLINDHVTMPGNKLGDHVVFLNGYAFKSQWFKEAGTKLCRNINVGHGSCVWKEVAHVEQAIADEFKRFELKKDDIVLSLDRPLISTGLKIARIREADLPCLLLQRVARPTPKHADLDLDFLFLWFMSPKFTDSIDPGRSNGVPHISTSQLLDLEFRVPTIEGQRSTVKKASLLLNMIRQLEAQLEASRTTGEKLLEAMVAELTAA
jgi:type I restriction enzyme S subunit